MQEVIVAQIGLIQALGVAVIGGIFALLQHRAKAQREAEREEALEYRKQREETERKRERDAEEREEARKELSAAMLGLVFSVAEGTEVLLRQAHGERVNGNVDAALKSIESARGKCNGIVNKMATKS